MAVYRQTDGGHLEAIVEILEWAVEQRADLTKRADCKRVDTVSIEQQFNVVVLNRHVRFDAICGVFVVVVDVNTEQREIVRPALAS